MKSLHILTRVGLSTSIPKIVGCTVLMAAHCALAHGFSLDNTHILSVQQGSYLSDKMRGITTSGFELQNGNWQSFDKFYRVKWTDTSIKLLTQATPKLGIIWGLSTGEQSKRHQIDPSLTLGFHYLHPVSRQSYFTTNFQYKFGGHLRESACVADYGEVMGTHQVNCRLAHTMLSPQETLAYLMREKPMDQLNLQIKWSYQF
jgi:hypothetical protein